MELTINGAKIELTRGRDIKPNAGMVAYLTQVMPGWARPANGIRQVLVKINGKRGVPVTVAGQETDIHGAIFILSQTTNAGSYNQDQLETIVAELRKVAGL